MNEAYETTQIVFAKTRRTEIATTENEPLDIENLMRRTSISMSSLSRSLITRSEEDGLDSPQQFFDGFAEKLEKSKNQRL